MSKLAPVLLSCLFLFVKDVLSHGRLIEPPSRSTMWRYGFSTPPNYNDHELYCGGFSRQWRTNGGKCGICGDPWDIKEPRPNEAGGLYGKGILVRKYEKNSVMKVRVELTANHMGYFEFRVCPNNNPSRAATQKCLDQYKLRNVNTGQTKFLPGPGNRVFELHYQLPKDLTCRQCVFQWRYVAGNNWGTCANGSEAVGCGPQEEFRACADITITEPDGTADNTPNTLFDDDKYVPTDVKPIDYYDINDNTIETVDEAPEDEDVDVDVNVDSKDLLEEVAVESVVIIVLSTLLVVLLFFGALFLYYTKGRRFLRNFSENYDWPPDFRLPSLPSVSLPKSLKNTASNINWPLSNIQIKKLPSFIKKKKTSVEIQNNRNISSPVRDTSAELPKPPPRAKKTGPQITAVRVATIAPRQHQSNRMPPQHPKVAPPPPPPNKRVVSPTLEIGAPMAVTINGVSVTHNESQMSRVEASSPTSKSFVVPATLAMAHEDIPDSMTHSSLLSSSKLPPPLPDCPPPDEDESFTEA